MAFWCGNPSLSVKKFCHKFVTIIGNMLAMAAYELHILRTQLVYTENHLSVDWNSDLIPYIYSIVGKFCEFTLLSIWRKKFGELIDPPIIGYCKY